MQTHSDKGNKFIYVSMCPVLSTLYIFYTHTHTHTHIYIVLYNIIHMCVPSLICLQIFVTPWTVAHQVPLSVGFFKQEYWSGLLFSPPEDLLDSGMEPMFPALAGRLFSTDLPANLMLQYITYIIYLLKLKG